LRQQKGGRGRLTQVAVEWRYQIQQFTDQKIGTFEKLPLNGGWPLNRGRTVLLLLVVVVVVVVLLDSIQLSILAESSISHLSSLLQLRDAAPL